MSEVNAGRGYCKVCGFLADYDVYVSRCDTYGHLQGSVYRCKRSGCGKFYAPQAEGEQSPRQCATYIESDCDVCRW